LGLVGQSVIFEYNKNRNDKMVMKDKTNNKDNKITVRLTPNQSFMLNEMASVLGVKKSVLVRYILD
jgi:hypothetical protein